MKTPAQGRPFLPFHTPSCSEVRLSTGIPANYNLNVSSFFLVFHYRAVSLCLALPYLALPRLALPCPALLSDYQRAGQILDDELNALLVRPLAPGVTLHAVVDACHSGTVMDLSFRTKNKRGQGMIWKGRPLCALPMQSAVSCVLHLSLTFERAGH
jgi:hypothetical protein